MAPHRTFLDEGNISALAVYYRQATKIRNSSYPFISGDTFRALADHIYDETRRDSLSSIKTGDIVFLKGDSLFHFFATTYSKIPNPFILITHNSDFYGPGIHGQRLNDKKIIAWFVSNPDVPYHPKLFPIPIGLANRRWIFGNLTNLLHAFENYRIPWENRTIKFYVNVGMQGTKKERIAAFERTKNISGAVIVKSQKSSDAYYNDLGNSKFVFSPPGNGLDCHRTWEALLLGAVPVVRSSGLDPLFLGIPAIIVPTWLNLTEKVFDSYKYTEGHDMMPAVLYARYWKDRIWKLRADYLKSV